MYYLLWFLYVMPNMSYTMAFPTALLRHQWPQEAPVSTKERLIYHVYNDNENEV